MNGEMGRCGERGRWCRRGGIRDVGAESGKSYIHNNTVAPFSKDSGIRGNVQSGTVGAELVLDGH